MTNGEASALLTSDGDLVLFDKFANVLEADRGFMELNFVLFCQRIDEIGSGHRFRLSILPAASFRQIVKGQCDDVVGLKKCSVSIDDAESVGIAVSGDADVRTLFAHL